jgi:hypothetical protein
MKNVCPKLKETDGSGVPLGSRTLIVALGEFTPGHFRYESAINNNYIDIYFCRVNVSNRGKTEAEKVEVTVDGFTWKSPPSMESSIAIESRAPAGVEWVG